MERKKIIYGAYKSPVKKKPIVIPVTTGKFDLGSLLDDKGKKLEDLVSLLLGLDPGLPSLCSLL